MTATKLLHTYRYHDGEWETREPMGPGPTRGDAEALGFEFELWNGTHDDEVEMWGYEGAPGNERRVTLTVRGGLAPTDTLDADPWEGIRYSSRYSAAYKWSYTDAVLYGHPRTPHEPHVVVLEIAEDAFSDTGDEEYAKAYGPVAPFPYLVYAEGIGLTSQTIFVDGFPDLVRLLNELLPLIGRPTPRMATLYRLHKWWASWGHFPLEIAE